MLICVFIDILAERLGLWLCSSDTGCGLTLTQQEMPTCPLVPNYVHTSDPNSPHTSIQQMAAVINTTALLVCISVCMTIRQRAVSPSGFHTVSYTLFVCVCVCDVRANTHIHTEQHTVCVFDVCWLQFVVVQLWSVEHTRNTSHTKAPNEPTERGGTVRVSIINHYCDWRRNVVFFWF